MTIPVYIGKDQNWQNESTTYWFDLGHDTFGVVESEGRSEVVDCEGFPIKEWGTYNRICRLLEGVVTDAMRDN